MTPLHTHTTQHNTTQHNTHTQHNTTQHNTTQHNTNNAPNEIDSHPAIAHPPTPHGNGDDRLDGVNVLFKNAKRRKKKKSGIHKKLHKFSSSFLEVKSGTYKT
jgi:hypothetical protein